MNSYEEYLVYLDTLHGVARYPYTTVVENLPDKFGEYRRPFTRDEWENFKEAENKMIGPDCV